MSDELQVNPAVQNAIDADPTIRPEAKAQLIADLSRAIGPNDINPDKVKFAVDFAKNNSHKDYLLPPDPAVEPGSLAASAAEFRARQGRYPSLGLRPTETGPTVWGVADPYKAPPVPTEPPSIADQLARFMQSRQQHMGVGLKPEPKQPKGA